MDNLDVIVIGAGPAGLTAGYVLKNNHISYLIIEKGKLPQDREKNKMEDEISGVGGGGLFSDGKLSFSPSGSWMWKNLNRIKLEKSYNILRNLFNECNIKLPNFDFEWIINDNFKEISGEKKYKSLVLNSYCQLFLLGYLYQVNKDNLISESAVIKIEKNYNRYIITTNMGNVYYCKQIIFATGKFGYSNIQTINISENLCKKSRVEVGIRFECDSEYFKPCDSETIDYKFIDKISDADEIRTFCCSKHGIVIKSKFNEWITYNSAKTEVNSNRASIGVLIRSENPQSVFFNEMKDCINQNNYFFNLTASDYFQSAQNFIGEKCDQKIKDFIINRLVRKGVDFSSSFVYGPEIEYVGDYYCENDNLQITEDFYIVGDVSGLYRGLLPAMISGIFSATEILTKKTTYINNNIESLGINISDSEPMELVFTAQSKKFFYCRDVICQYVLEHNKLPLNPFRVFEYFLGDRVSRDVIRRGNNQLIKSCKELWVFGPIADGVLFEIALAKTNGKRIRFFTIGSTKNEIIEITDLKELTFEPEVHSKKIKKEDLISFVLNEENDDGQLRIEW